MLISKKWYNDCAKHQGSFKQFVDRFYTSKPDKVAQSGISVSLVKISTVLMMPSVRRLAINIVRMLLVLFVS
jgi:hypothetical protein